MFFDDIENKISDCCNAEIILYQAPRCKNGEAGISYNQCSKCKRALTLCDMKKKDR